MTTRMGPTDIQIAFSKIRLELMAIARRHPDELKTMVDLSDILDIVQPLCQPADGESEPTDIPVHAARPKQAAAIADDPKLYYRVMSADGMCLAEDRKRAGETHFVPMSIYQRAAELLADHPAGPKLSMADLVEELHAIAPSAADHMLHVCLRFWQQADPPLVTISNGHCNAMSPDNFPRLAADLWDQLPRLET